MKNTKIASVVLHLIFLLLCGSLGATGVDVASFRSPNGAVEQKLTQNDGFQIGQSVALSGNVAVVGAPKSNNTKGAAYVYSRTCPTCSWTLAQRLTASDGVSSDRFGDAVAFDGQTMLIGATNAAGSGAAYTFTSSGGTWVQGQKLLPHDGAAGDLFGYSVAIAGPHVLVGAYAARVNTIFAQGAAYRYYRVGAVGSTFLEAEKLTASDGDFEDEFGWSVGLTEDTAFVGARLAAASGVLPEAGAVYVFDNPCSTGTCQPHWPQTQRLVPTNPSAGMNYGFSVAIEGTTAIVGAPYTNVGGPSGVRQGVAYVLSKQLGGWVQEEELIASDGMAHDQFGTAVAISGGNIVIGAEFANPNSAGAAYVFKPSGLTWDQTDKLTAGDAFHLGGYGISVGYSGNTVLVGSPYTPDGSRGAAYSYIVP